MSAEEEAVVNAAGLMIFERWQVGEGRGGGFVEDGFGHGLQGAPAGPVEVGGVGDLAEKAAPFDDDAVDVAGAKEVGEPRVLVERVLVNGGDYLLGADAVFGRDAVFEITGYGLKAEGVVADEPKAAAPAVGVFTAKTESGVEIGEIVNEFVEGIRLVLERGGDGKSVALGKETDNAAAKGGHSGAVHEPEPAPKEGDAGAGGELAADGDEGASGAIGGEDLALGRPPKCDAVGIDGDAQGEVRDADVGDDAVGLVPETDDRCPLLGELLFEERDDFAGPDGERGLAAVPVG